MIKVNITYKIISHESASVGDFHESGFKEQGLVFNTRTEALEYFSKTYGCFEQGNEDAFYTVDADRTYTNGHETYYGIHFN